MPLMLITTKFSCGSNPAHGEVNSIQHYVIKFLSDLRHHNPNPVKLLIILLFTMKER